MTTATPRPAADDQLGAHDRDPFASTDRFERRHNGPDATEVERMLGAIGVESLATLMDQSIPASIRMDRELELTHPARATGLSETDALGTLREIAGRNRVWRSYIGMGYCGTVTPSVIQRTILENPCWYTQYTPYQAEIAQGRLEALLNFQTMIADLTGLPIAGASLLDEGTAAAEAMSMCAAAHNHKRTAFFVAQDCHPQTIAVMETRAEGLGIELVIGDVASFDADAREWAGILLQYPATDGRVVDHADVAARAGATGALVVAAADPMSLALLAAPGEWGADICVGSAQRFGVPMGFGGPHAAFLSCTEKLVRKMPGRLIGVSRDRHGDVALRMAIQTREQHIKRDRATSNICTAQVLLAIMASMYGVYHGPDGLKRIAGRIHRLANTLAAGVRKLGHEVVADAFFDTIRVRLADSTSIDAVLTAATERRINLRRFHDDTLGVQLDETVTRADLEDLLACFALGAVELDLDELERSAPESAVPASLRRTSAFMEHAIFNSHHSETELLRYITKLQSRDLSLAHSMIPLGSCTMKLNAASEMLPVTWPEFGNLHPFAPQTQTEGYTQLFEQLESWLAEITGFTAVSLQPNAGSQGEYSGLMAIRAYHRHAGDLDRDACLIPVSAHGTNPASAVIAGMRVVPIKCDEQGDVDMADLRGKLEKESGRVAACMITYPSTHGVFEERIRELCDLVHEAGGLVYMDGANMNAQVGLTRPGDIGADVCHLNLHKTFCIPHGGGGPGMGPIGVNDVLKPFLPSHPVVRPHTAGQHAMGPVSAAPYGSPSILVISWMYIAMMGATGLRRATEIAILNANYMATRLKDHYDVLFTNENDRCAHEFILDCRPFDKSAGIKIDDIAKRLIDFGFHAPTMSWPVPGTLMIEPTESESLAELDRFCDAMIAIREEIAAIESGALPREDNPLVNAPHTIADVSADEWTHAYSRSQAGFPAEWLRDAKFWPFVGRVDNPYGDRNLVCSCVGMEAHGDG